MLPSSVRRRALSVPTGWRRPSAFVVTAIVVAAYALWLVAALRHASPQDFVHVGRILVNKSHASAAISGPAATYHYDGDIGFDGQYAYFIAVDPVNARFYLDSPAYRYTRIVYPIAARVLALGRAELVPWTLILVNLAMVGVGVGALAAWLRRHGVSAWYAAVYGFYPGVLITLQRDTTEIMAYSLVALAVLLFDARGPRLLLSGLFFGLAALTRETTAVFALGYSVALVLQNRQPATGSPPSRVVTSLVSSLPRASVFVALWAGPLLAWKIFLRLWLGSWGLDAHLERIPFMGILSYVPWSPGLQDEVRIVVIPAILCGIAALWALRRRRDHPETWLLLANVLILVVFLERQSFNDISSGGRITIGVVLAAMLALPFLTRLRLWIWAAAALWLTPMLYWFVAPVAKTYLAALRRRL